MVEIIGIKFKNGGKVYFFNPRGIEFTPGEKADKLIQHIKDGVDKTGVQKEIEVLFDTYYSTDYHIKHIAEMARDCLK